MNASRLELFTSKGYKIPTQSIKSVTFTVIGSTWRSDRNYGWREDATGYFTTSENNKVLSSTIENAGGTYSFDPSSWNTNIDYYDATLKLIDEIVVTLKIGDKTYKKSFTNEDPDDCISKYFDIEIGMKKEYVRAQSSNAQDNVVYTFCLENIMPIDQDFFIEDTFREVVEADGSSIDDLWPSIQFLGSLDIEKVSVGLAGVETIFILERQDDGTYKRPKSTNQAIRLEVASSSTVKFVKYADEWVSEDLVGKEYDVESIDYSKVYWSNYKAFNLPAEFDEDNDNQPLVVTIGFIANEEGCYQDIITVKTVDHISDVEKDIKKNTIGYLAVQSEAVGEDERYRTLFANFGIPDPKEYQNVFKDMPIYEEGQDWDFINKKSKQLFLSYSEIFPYVGTYKALINAVKYLGYNDIYFKEWYMHFDGNFESKVSYESLDISTGQTLSSKLKRAGVSLENFIEWKKLNQLSLIYKINEEDEEFDDVDYYKKVDVAQDLEDDGSDEDDENIVNGWEKGLMRFEVPSTKPVYSYLNLEVLAKLFALKEWLEKYILNINCQIIDVTGEGVFFSRLKEVGYAVGYETYTEEKEEHISPIFDIGLSDLKMQDSRAKVCCTLKEIKNGMTYEDLAGKKIKTYINKIYEALDDSSMTEMKKESWYDTESVGLPPEDICLVGKPASISIPFEELQYELTTDTSCGTMKKGVGVWVTDPSTGEKTFEEIPLLVLDGEMYVFKNRVNEIEFSTPPIIRVKCGTLRKPYGPWNKNTKYSIQTYFDPKSRHTKYTFQSEETGFHKEYNDYVTLYPRYVNDGQEKKWVSKLKYTSSNKYNVPMLVIENYDTYDHFFLDEKKSELIKRYIDASVSISNDYNSVSDTSIATDSEMDLVREKRNALHREAIDIWTDDLDQFTALYNSNEYNEGFNKYLLLIDEGFIEAKEDNEDPDVTETVRIVFEPKYTMTGGEQDIHTKYTYTSKMTPSIEFDSSMYEAKYQEIKDAYYDRIAELDVLIEDASEYRGAILEDGEYQYVIKASEEQAEYFKELASEREKERLAYITIYNTTSGKGKALEEYLNWMIKQNSVGNDRYQNLYNITYEDLDNKLAHIRERFLAEYASQKEKAYTKLLADLEDLKNQCFLFHKDKTFTVKHLGDYSLIVKGIDGYNAPFVAKSNMTSTVYGMRPTVFINDSNNAESEGTVSVSDLVIGEDPTLWPRFRRPISNTGVTDSSLEYLNWSYILDTPKDGDFLKVANLTERVNKIITSEEGLGNDRIKIILNDENPQHQNLFYKNALIKLFFIDRNTNELVDQDEQISGPYTVIDYSPIPDNDIQENDNNWIILGYSSNYEEFKGMSQDTIAAVNSKTIDCYASLTSKIEISESDIENDYNSKTCKIKVRSNSNFNNLAFKAGQCVKIEFSQMTYVGETPSTDMSSKTSEIVTERYSSGTTYRVKDAWYDSKDFSEVYLIDGLVNNHLLIPEFYNNEVYNYLSETPRDNIKNVPYKVRCTIAPAHTTYTSYVIQATMDAAEDSDTGWLTYKDNWHAKDFLDNTFSFTMAPFNIYDAYRDWFKETLAKNMFIHRDPVTNILGNNMIASSADEDGTYEDNEYLKIWDVYVNQGHSKDDNILLFQVTNDNVPITLNYKGEYHFELTSIDAYGNKLVNKSEGFLKTLS